VTDDRKLIGEISPSTLTGFDEFPLIVLSAVDFMAYIDWCTSPPDTAVWALKSLLKKKGMHEMVELMDVVSRPVFSSSTSSSFDEEGEIRKWSRQLRRLGSYSSRMGRRLENAIVCHPGSSLVAFMVQALAHIVGYVWVIEEDYGLEGIVVLRDILKVFRDYCLRRLRFLFLFVQLNLVIAAALHDRIHQMARVGGGGLEECLVVHWGI
ncbi:CBS domain-containing protein CBSX5-like, partial [Dendrobium catenatum]|uniref:CBS domain-containing protein CBSX5-like n=1 Tax=Dendrobium catenatum TaxID=906689 RepID=UPI00109F966F